MKITGESTITHYKGLQLLIIHTLDKWRLLNNGLPKELKVVLHREDDEPHPTAAVEIE